MALFDPRERWPVALLGPDERWPVGLRPLVLRPLALQPRMGGVCPGPMGTGAICPHRVLPRRIHRPGRPGAIIITGVVNAGGTEHPGRAIDDATFAGGGFRIDHSAGHPSASFNTKTCVGTIDQTGPFRVIDGTGRFSGLAGSGTYVFHALYTTARDASGCTKVMTGYIESIDGTATLSPSVARGVKTAAG